MTGKTSSDVYMEHLLLPGYVTSPVLVALSVFPVATWVLEKWSWLEFLKSVVPWSTGLKLSNLPKAMSSTPGMPTSGTSLGKVAQSASIKKYLIGQLTTPLPNVASLGIPFCIGLGRHFFDAWYPSIGSVTCKR